MQYQLENQSCSQHPGYFLEEKVLKKEANYQIYLHLWLSITYHRLWIDPVFWDPECMQSILYPWWVPLGIQAVKIVSKWIYNLMPSIPGGWNHQPSKLPSYPVSPNMASWEITRHSMELCFAKSSKQVLWNLPAMELIPASFFVDVTFIWVKKYISPTWILRPLGDDFPY